MIQAESLSACLLLKGRKILTSKRMNKSATEDFQIPSKLLVSFARRRDAVGDILQVP